MIKPQKLLAAVALAILLPCTTLGQDLKRFNLGFDFGASTYYTSFKENSAIRMTSSVTFFDQTGSAELETSTHRTFYGIKAELLSPNGFIGIGTGVRFTHISSDLDRERWFDFDKTKFFVMYNQDGVNTEYAQVGRLKQRADYIGIPLDFRFYTSRPRFFRFFFKLGFDFNMRIANDASVTFVNSTMSRYKQQVADAIGKPAAVLTTINPGLGFKFGSSNSVNFCFEINGPSYIMSTNASTFAKNSIGIGAQFYLYYPIL